MLFKLRTSNHAPAVEQREVQLAGSIITYTLKRSRKRRSIGLRIDDRGLTVSMPLRASERWLQTVLHEKAQWIVEKLGSWQSRKVARPQWCDGEKIPFRGEMLILRIIPSLFATPPQLQREQLLLHVTDISNTDKIEQTVMRWYRQEAERVFRECVEFYAERMGVAPKQVKLSSAKTQWGSCNSHGVVRFNWQLVKMPLHLIDYVVVHELAHLREMNHSAAFWNIVASACENHLKCRAELHAYGISE